MRKGRLPAREADAASATAPSSGPARRRASGADSATRAAIRSPSSRSRSGLVFYDLKTCLRMLEREEEAKAAKATKTATRRRTTKKETEEAESESS